MHKKTFRAVCAILLTISLLLASGFAAAEKTIMLTFTGDCTIGSEERTRAREDSFDSIAAARGYDYFFANFRELFEADDLTVINFEGVLSDSRAQESQRKTYRFRGPTDFAKILTGSSIEACSLANNHIGDFGKQGEDNTKKTLEENGISWFQGFDVYVYEKDGIKIGFMALDNITYNKGFEKLRKLISDMKARGEVNAFVVCWHTGLEYRGNHEAGTERNTRNVIKAGADLIIVNHPHVLQGVDVFNNRTVFYSLGNFVFGGNNKIETRRHLVDQTVTSLYTAVVQAKLVFTNDGRYMGQQVTILPALTTGTDPVNNYQPRRATAEEAEAVRFAIQRDTAFELPPVTTDENGQTRIEMDYQAAFDDVLVPEGEQQMVLDSPEAPAAVPTRQTKGE